MWRREVVTAFSPDRETFSRESAVYLMSDNYILLLKGKYNVKEQSGVSGQKYMQGTEILK